MDSKQRIEGYEDMVYASSGYTESDEMYFRFLKSLVTDLDMHEYSEDYKQGAYDFLNSEYDRLKGNNKLWQ